MKGYIRKAISKASDKCLGAVDILVSQTSRGRLEHYPPVFVIGPARSGTTLVYQCMVAGLKVSYITNLMNRIPSAPFIGWKLSELASSYDFEFNSRFGRTSGMSSPNQGISVWTRWFPGGGRGSLTEEEKISLYTFVSLVQGASKRPFLNKWQGHNEHLDQIDEIFPRSLFVYVTRDTVDTVCSLNRAWRKLVGDPNRFFSRPTASYYKLRGENILHNSCAYVIAAKHDISRWLDGREQERVIRIEYRDVCNDPRSVVEHVGGKYEGLSGVDIRDKSGLGKVPIRFDQATYSQAERREVIGKVDVLFAKLNCDG